ncbi:MAG: DNA-binding transcriptional regulator [Pirellulales bacterium]|nr:DNA-binding transcriptional regulator [Pirellulales bacterium]MBX3433192.1 DNA-binding transcriptional regulator [Pirellulales bacterium]
MPLKTPKVALLIETSRGYGRGLLRGISRYAKHHGPWEFYITPGDFAQHLPRIKQWSGDGIIARLETPAIARDVCAANLPTIILDVSQNIPLDMPELQRFSEVASDSVEAGRMAAEHLLDRGFKQFAYVGEHGRIWSHNREAGFRSALQKRGFDALVYEGPRNKQKQFWEREQAVLAEWLAALPKPIGVMACNDDRGRQVLDACLTAGVKSPLEAAVVGVDNDELLCELAMPPLSSVALNSDAGGYRAAALLDDLMAGRRRKPQRVTVEPIGVVERRSTQATAQYDPDVAAAIHFIHDHAGQNIGVDDVVRHVHMSRRTLEIRFRDVVGRSPYHELQRVRVERARRLLMETDLPIPRVAAAAGFSSNAYLAQVFQKWVGKTPSQIRRQHRT